MTSRRRCVAALAAGMAALVAGRAAAGPAAASAEALAARLRQRLSDAPVQRGQFEQRKTVAGFKHPLVSRGDYLFARERGVVWRTREPFASTLVLTRDRLVSRTDDGRGGTPAADTQQSPALRVVNSLMFALLAADLAALGERFRMEGEVPAQGPWRVVLSPRDAALGAWIQHIELQGDRQVQAVQWREPSGDETHLKLSGQSTAAQLDRDEAARFE